MPSIAFFRTYSRLITLNRPVSIPDNSILEGSKSTPSGCVIMALPGGCSSSMTDCIREESEISNSSGFFTPRLTVKLPCGSASTSKTFLPESASPTPRLTAVVVLPTPPFWFVMAITLQFSMWYPPFIEIYSSLFPDGYVTVRYLSSTPHAQGIHQTLVCETSP